MAEKREHLVYLDAVKVFAMFMVFALHTQRGENVTDPCSNAVLFYAARCCMPLFFMVNGSLMLRRESFTIHYYRKKIAGIARVLIMSGICIGLYVFLFHHFSPMRAVKEMLKGFLSYTKYAYLWFLYSFALIYTLLLFGFDMIKRNLNRILCMLCAVCIAAAVGSFISVMNGGFFIQEAITQRLRLWTWMFYFCLGYKLSLVRISPRMAHVLQWTAPVLTAISIAWQYWLCFRMTGQVESNCMYDDAVVMLQSAAVFLLFRISPRLSAMLARFCSCSFGAFLIHGFLVDAFRLRSAAVGPLQAGTLWIILLAACWFLSWGLSFIPGVRRLLQY